nr:hypothetical protein [Tanacetum cinerariifolium]
QREQELRKQEQAAQEKEELPQNSVFRQLIEEMCGIKVCEEQKQNMEDTMLELLEDCRQKELYCMHNDVEDLIKSALNSKLLSINLKSQRLDKEKQEVKNIVEHAPKRKTHLTKCLKNFKIIHNESIIPLNKMPQISSVNAITPDLSTEEPKYSLSMGDEHLSTIPEIKSDEVIKSSVENLVPIPSESEGISDDTCDVPVCEDSSTFDTFKGHSEILSDSNDDGTSSNDDAFEDIEYVEASPLDSELVSLEEVNDVDQEEKKIDLEDILQIQDVILRKKLLNINHFIAKIESLNDNPTPDRVLKSPSSFPIPVTDSDSFFEESDTSLSYLGNSLPELETFNHTEETSSGSTTTHADNSLLEYESFLFEIKPDQGELTNVVMETILEEPRVHMLNIYPPDPTWNRTSLLQTIPSDLVLKFLFLLDLETRFSIWGYALKSNLRDFYHGMHFLSHSSVILFLQRLKLYFLFRPKTRTKFSILDFLDFKDSRARCFVHLSLDLPSFDCL